MVKFHHNFPPFPSLGFEDMAPILSFALNDDENFLSSMGLLKRESSNSYAKGTYHPWLFPLPMVLNGKSLEINARCGRRSLNEWNRTTNPFPSLCVIMENETPEKCMKGVGIADMGLALTWDADDLTFNSDPATK